MSGFSSGRIYTLQDEDGDKPHSLAVFSECTCSEQELCFSITAISRMTPKSSTLLLSPPCPRRLAVAWISLSDHSPFQQALLPQAQQQLACTQQAWHPPPPSPLLHSTPLVSLHPASPKIRFHGPSMHPPPPTPPSRPVSRRKQVFIDLVRSYHFYVLIKPLAQLCRY